MTSSHLLKISALPLIVVLLIPGCKRAAPLPAENRPTGSGSNPAPASSPTPTPAANTPASRPSGPIRFTEVTQQAGIHFRRNSGAFGMKYLPETMGSGVCVLDYDKDGWQDILFVNSMD